MYIMPQTFRQSYILIMKSNSKYFFSFPHTSNERSPCLDNRNPSLVKNYCGDEGLMVVNTLKAGA